MIRHLYTTDLPDPGRYLTPGDLVLTGMMWRREPGDADRFAKALAQGGRRSARRRRGSRRGTGRAHPGVRRHGITLLAVPAETSFATVTEEVGSRCPGTGRRP